MQAAGAVGREIPTAYLDLEQLAAHHTALRRAERHLRAICGQPVYGESDACWLWEDPRAVWGPGWRVRRTAKVQPWPETPVGFLLWAVTEAPLPLWLPSAQQQDVAGEALVAAEKGAVAGRVSAGSV